MEFDLSRMKRGTRNQATKKKMSEQLNEQYNSVFSTADPTMTIKYQKDFFRHPQAKIHCQTIYYINITKHHRPNKNYLTKLF